MECSLKTLAAGLVVFVVLLLQQAPVLVLATDADPLQDFCVADLGSEVTVNGHACKPASAAGDEFLFSNKIATGGDVNANPNGSNVTELDVAEWPGVNTLGVSMNRVDFAPGGTNPPHVHPRATEIGVVLRGELLVGIIGSLDSGNRLYSKVVRAGETFVIPRGLMHFQFNVGKTEATMVVSFNSQNPGIVFVPLTLFGSNPPIPTPVLVKALRVDAGVVELLKSKFTGGY
ncbi:germin-like protein 3-6 [Oryza brachyantha]|uniref:germin-like protein 3-6 n=1 Tax=Oryza brachyantha TaxID=4533 RepID=UPI001ADC3E4F|nr:germin-like protein 3-6 [Oryza brachyantha]